MTTVKILFFAVFLISSSAYATADSQEEREKRHIVSRLYEMTESMTQRCSHAQLVVASKYQHEVSRFIEAYPRLMTLVKQSAYYEYAQRNFSYKGKSEGETKETLTSSCDYFSGVIGAMVDDPRGVSEVNKFENILSK